MIIPSIGRIVHFILPTGEHRPAIIVKVWDRAPHESTPVNLQVFTDGENEALPNVMHRCGAYQAPANQGQVGTWHESERV